ncbi:MAG: hypothetical protein DWQ05_15295 [Calditrichaeota bacterium]|nr:MAG: hypothetical protein DWQ05_15295 [Calditrichota bacterium]
MKAINHLHVRDARDRLIDLLKIGQTAPLRDLAVVDEPVIVAFDTPAQIPVNDSQRDVLYHLFENGATLENGAYGNGNKVELSTAPIQADKTLEIHARKRKAAEIFAGAPAEGHSTTLHQKISIKVGLDLLLKAWIANEEHLEKSTLHNATDARPRLVDYGAHVQVTIAKSQVGIKYKLVSLQLAQGWKNVDEIELSENEVTGNRSDIDLDTQSFFEDTDIRIKATKIFDASAEGNAETGFLGKALFSAAMENETDLNNHALSAEFVQKFNDLGREIDEATVSVNSAFWLITDRNRAEYTVRKEDDRLIIYEDLILPLKVRANANLTVSVDPAPIVDYAAPASVKILNTQTSADYQLFAGGIRDRDFLHGEIPPEREIITVNVPDEPDVQVLMPETNLHGNIPVNFSPTGLVQSGTEGTLELTTELLHEDSFILVRAMKSHFAHDASDPEKIIESAVQVKQVVAVLVRPNPDPALNLIVEMNGDKTNGSVLVDDGQPGIFYHFFTQPDDNDISLPAYFHKKDDLNPVLNKGLDALKIGVDFAITRNGEGDPLTVKPKPPLLATDPLSAGTELFIRALKAQTRAGVPLLKSALIKAVPEIHLENTEVESGKQTKIKIVNSHVGDKYNLFWNNALQRAWKAGTGNDLTFNTPAINSDMTIEVHIIRDDATSISVKRVVRLFVKVQSN